MLRTSAQRELCSDVELLYTMYCEVLDDSDVELWPGFFTDDGIYRITTRENVSRGLRLSLAFCEGKGMLRDRAASLRTSVFFRTRRQRRIISGVRLKTFEGVASFGIEVCASFVVYESVEDEPSKLLACGRSHDTIIRENDELKFKVRTCIVDARGIPDSLVYPI